MNIFKRIAGKFREYMSSFVKGGYELLVRPRGSSNYPVTPDTMLTYAPIWYSINKISGHIGQIPRGVKRTRRDGTVEETDRSTSRMRWNGRLWDMLNLDPNGLMSAMDLFETVHKDAIFGNGRLGIVRTNGIPTQLIRLAPYSTCSFLVSEATNASLSTSDSQDVGTLAGGWEKWHEVTDSGGETFYMHDSDVIHVKGLQHDGINGIDLDEVCRDSVGGAKTQEAFTNRTFVNDAIPGLILTAPEGVLNDNNKAKEFLDSFNAHQQGSQKGRTALLRHGVTASQLSQTGEQAQLLELRQFSRDEAWLWTGDIQFYSGADNVYRNGAELDSAYKQQTLARWVVKWEQELTLKLLTQQQRDLGWHIDLDMSVILRGTMKEQFEIIQIARQMGVWSEEASRRMIGNQGPRVDGENYENPNTSSPFGASQEEPSSEMETATVESAALLTLPAPRSYGDTLERDKWIYEAHADGSKTIEGIVESLPWMENDWEPICTARGLRNASHRYADFHDLPRVNRHARPALPSGTP